MKQQYKSYNQTKEFLFECVRNYPHLIKVESIGKTWEDRDIYLATISLDLANEKLKPALLYTGTIHAREWIGNELAVAFIDYILKNYNKNPKIQEILLQTTIYIVPCLNPDGFEYSREHFSFWRKNRRNNGDGTFGVDLNRNFSIGFTKTNNTASNVYSGPEPFSEPETKAIKNFVDNHTNITIALDYHSQGNVFFPAHKFRHESEIDGTDLNTLCANLNDEIYKVTKRRYGIHRGKPPTKLISGSGREYYYSKGIIASVVEVGTRNIPDYMQNMSESIAENIPALLLAVSEAKNYSKIAPKRPNNFKIENFSNTSVTLTWDYDECKDIYFEIYRNEENKQACKENSLIAITSDKSFCDMNLESGKTYYYYIRAFNNLTKLKSPFAPKVKIKTKLNKDEFNKIIFPKPNEVGYVASKLIESNYKHFGVNSLFIGVNEVKGVSYGIMKFDLSNIPSNAKIKQISFSLYPLNRVNAKIEKYGEWIVSILDSDTISDLTDFYQVQKAKVIQTLGHTIPSERLTQGIWSHWKFNEYERKLVEKELKKGYLILKVSGPESLPLGRDSQMMMFDLGYGKFGGGIHYRPNLEIKYTINPTKVILEPKNIATIFEDKVDFDNLMCGFDKNGNKIYAFSEFDLSTLADFENTIITNCYIEISKKRATRTKKDIRYNLEFVDIKDIDYKNIKTRERIEFIGYEISRADLTKDKTHTFIFDEYSKDELELKYKDNKNVQFVIKPTFANVKEHFVYWKNIKLVIEYINKRRYPPKQITNLKLSIVNNKIKLTWDNPDCKDFVGAFVVRNRWHIPKNPFDGDKIYAGKDNYTFDAFGSLDIDKYYAIFTYDNVPNYSEGVFIEYKVE